MRRSKPRFRSRPVAAEAGVLTGLHPVREALRARRRTLGVLRLEGSPRPEWEELRALARDAGVRVVEEPASAVGSEATRAPWVRLEAGALPETDLPALLSDASMPPHTLVALDGVEDPQNLGAIARVADASGVAGLVLTHRHAPPLSEAVSRASAGAIEWLPVCRVPNLVRALRALKEQGFWIVGADLEAETDLFSAPDAWLRPPRVLVMGSEGAGLRRSVTEAIDHRVRIPMSGRVASLNVSTAAAVILFELARRDRAREGRPGSGEPDPTDAMRGAARATRPPFPSGTS